MPNAHNNLTDKLPMTLTIKKVIPYQEFSFQLDSQKTVISFVLVKESNGKELQQIQEAMMHH